MILAIAPIVVPNGSIVLALLASTAIHRVPRSVLNEIVVVPGQTGTIG